VLSEAISRIIDPPKVKRKEDAQYIATVKEIFSLLDNKQNEKAKVIAHEAGISALDFEDLRTTHFWDWNN
jgi:hypothetical protein